MSKGSPPTAPELIGRGVRTFGGGCVELVGTAIWIIVLIFELWAAKYRPTWTASHVVRRIFHTESSAIGPVVFLVVWVPVAVWFGWHIVYDV